MTALLMSAIVHADTLPQVSSGRIERLADFPSQHVAPRTVDVWLPDGYPSAAPYAVVYMHDGQMLFDAQTTWNHQEWRVDEVASALIAEQRTRPFIVVGVFNGGKARHQEYFPQKPFEALPKARQRELYAMKIAPDFPLFAGPIDSDAYLKFLVGELKPYVDAHFAVARDAASTYSVGSSMGGLISLYALAEYPDVFGGAACLSTHWPGSFKPDHNPLPAAFFAYVERSFPRAGAHRIYFDHGTETLDIDYARLQRQVDARILAKGYRPGVDWITRAFPGAEHSERAWSARLEYPLIFLLRREP